MSTTGRSPVIAAPTPTPVKPASEIGVSITRLAPNSSTRPESTLNGVPASATSSPRMQTRESRRISSARASRTAWAKVSSRTCVSIWGINVLPRFFGARVRCVDGEVDSRKHFGTDFFFDRLQGAGIREFLSNEPVAEDGNGIPLRLPLLLFFLGAVIFAADITDVMAGIAVRVTQKKRRSLTATRAVDQSGRNVVDRANVLAIDALCVNAECGASLENVPGGGLRKMRVLRIEIVL